MAGLVVGVDGSDHAHRALTWAMKEAALRHARLTVLAVQEVAAAVKAQQKMTLDAATVWAEQVGKLYPTVPAGYAEQVRAQAKKSTEVYDELVAAHREFSERLLDVLVPAESRRKSIGYVQIRRTTRMPGDLYTTGPIRFTSPARAVADAARAMTRFSDVQALVCEAVQRGRCTLEELVGELNEGPTPGRRWYRMALAEGLVFATRLGLDPAAFLPVAKESAAYSQIMDVKGAKMLNGDFTPEGRVRQTLKDAHLMLDQARKAGQELPLLTIHAEILEACLRHGDGERDNSIVIEEIRRRTRANPDYCGKPPKA